MNSNNSQIYVSVIVPTYNHCKYISRTLDSILCQKTEYRFEILIGDDCSTDGTVDILKEYQRKYPESVKLFLSDENEGAVANISRLFPHAHGKYIAGCDGDDYWCDSSKLQKQVDFLETHPDFIGCAHEVRLVDDNGSAMPYQKLNWISKRRNYCLEKDFKGIFLPGHPSSLLRKNLFVSDALKTSIYQDFHNMIADRTTVAVWGVYGNFYRMSDCMGCYTQRITNNLTTNLYTHRTNNYQQEFDYTISLYEYITHHNIGININYHLAEIYLGAWRRFGKETKQLRKIILATATSRFGFALNVLRVLSAKFTQNIQRKWFEIICKTGN